MRITDAHLVSMLAALAVSWNFPLNALALQSGRGRAGPFRAHSSVFPRVFPMGHFWMLLCPHLGNGRCSVGAGEGARQTSQLLLTPCGITANPLPNRHIPATEGRSRGSR